MKRYATIIAIIVLATITSGCPRKDPPPKISVICIGDGFGGADCVTSDGQNVYKSPSELKDFWMTTENDQANYSAWCYGTTPKVTAKVMRQMRVAIK